MSEQDLLSELAAEAAAVATIPSDNNLSRARTLGQELIDKTNEVKELEEKLAASQEYLLELQHRRLPDLLNELGLDKIGVSGVDLVLGPFYKANIAAGWDKDKQDEGFAEVERLGGGDIIKNVVSIPFGRGQDVLTTAFLDVIVDPRFSDLLTEAVHNIDPGINDTRLPGVSVNRSIPWGTLTAFVKEQVEAGKVVALEKLGAMVGSIVKIKQRKGK